MQNTGKLIDVLLASCSCFSSRLFKLSVLLRPKLKMRISILAGADTFLTV